MLSKIPYVAIICLLPAVLVAQSRNQLGLGGGMFSSLDSQGTNSGYAALSFEGAVTGRLALVLRVRWHRGGTFGRAATSERFEARQFMQLDAVGRAYLGSSTTRAYWEAGYGPNILKLSEPITTDFVTNVGTVGVTSRFTLVDGITTGLGVQSSIWSSARVEGGANYTLSKVRMDSKHQGSDWGSQC